jgi:phage gp29-like protein
LAHLALAIGRNIAVAENVWGCVNGELRLVDVAPVTYDRLTFDANGQLRILTEEDRFEGITLPPNKFVTHAPHCMSGHPMRGGLLRVSALAYLGKHFAMKDWMVFAEVFGMPVRIARYDPSATAEEKRELLAMLESLGSDAAGVFSKAVELQLLEAGHGKTPPPYEKICTFFNRELSKAWLGGTLAVDMSDTQAGRYTSGPKVHNEVRLDLRQDDIVREGRTVRRDILSPITRLKFGADVPVPFFRRQLDLPRDQKQLADILGKAVNELRLKVPARWAHDALGVPMAETEEDVVTGTVDT